MILQPGSDDEIEVDSYKSSNESVEDVDFAEDVPTIDVSQKYEIGLEEDGELNDEPGANDGGEENHFVYTFQSSP